MNNVEPHLKFGHDSMWIESCCVGDFEVRSHFVYRSVEHMVGITFQPSKWRTGVEYTRGVCGIPLASFPRLSR